jgi:flagellar motor switch protein FliM
MALVRMKRADAQLSVDFDTVERIWSLALARAAQEELAVALRLNDFRLERRSLGELVEMLPETALICALDEGSGEATGVAVLDAVVMAGMVEAMTTGVVTPADRMSGRRPTRTDAALLAPVLDRALAALEAGAAEAGLGDLARGFRFAATVDGARGVSLLLEDVPYRLLAAELDLEAGARQGALLLAFPEGRATTALAPPAARDADFAAALAQQVGSAEARLDAVLLRLTLPLGTVMDLQVGQELFLPRADIARVFLEGLDGRRVATGKLGRNGNLRAVRLQSEAETPALIAPVPPNRVERRS